MSDILICRVESSREHAGWAVYHLTRKEWLARTACGSWFWTKNPQIRMVEKTQAEADYAYECARARGVYDAEEN